MRTRKNIRGKLLTYAILGFFSLIMFYPFLFTLFGSIVSTADFYETLILPLPKQDPVTFQNFALAFRTDFLVRPFFITVIRTVWYMAFSYLTSIACAYVFTFNHFKFKKTAFYIIMSSMMIPGIALMMPQYVFFARFPLVGGNDITGQGGSGFINTFSILLIGGLFSAYNIFLLRQAMTSLGSSYKESAEVDGAGYFRILLTVYTPMLKPLLAVIFLNVFIGQWNDYTFPLIYVGGKSSLHPIGLASVRLTTMFLTTDNGGHGQMDYPVVYAITLLMVLPPILAYTLVQKQFVEGLTMGGVKG